MPVSSDKGEAPQAVNPQPEESDKPLCPGKRGTLLRIDTGIARTLDVLAILFSVAVVGLMLFMVLARYVLGMALTGQLELIMLAAVALYMCGALIASRNRNHLVVDWIAGSLRNPRAQALHDALIATLTIIITVFFIVWAYRMFAWGIQRPQVTPAYRIPLWVPQASIMVAALGCFAYAVRDAIQAIRKFRSSK